MQEDQQIQALEHLVTTSKQIILNTGMETIG